MPVRGRGWRGACAGLLLATGWLLALAACASGAGASGGAGTLRVVAAENFWGSIAAQLGGDRVSVTSIISNPATDPHDYEPTAQDSRAFAGATFAIVNGAGYDAWAQQALDANPNGARAELDVGRLAGRKPGDNPHMWYSPSIVFQVANQITADLTRLDARDAAYFDQQHTAFTTIAMKPYTDLIAAIHARDAGTPVGATESIVVDLAAALGLDLITPPTLMKAIADGDDLTAADRATMSQQIAGKQITALIFNAQNTTSDVNGFVQAARAAGIPVVAITETLSPATDNFEQWQVAQLQALQAALAQATGR